MEAEEKKRHPGGRPRIFNTPEEMQAKIEEYFKQCDSRKSEVLGKGPEGETVVLEISDPARYTVPGLAYFLGFCSRTELPDYAKDHPEFSDTIRRARLKIEEQRVEDGTDPTTKNSNGIKFDLSNNFNYKDLQTIEIANAAKEFISTAISVIEKYVPEDKRGEARAKLQASIDIGE
jgi:hypothetical protein